MNGDEDFLAITKKLQEEEMPWIAKFFGVLVAIVMLVVALGFLNRFVEWSFGVGINI